MTVDCSTPGGAFRALHGVNNGPLEGGGLTDLSDFHRRLAFPFVRLHDVHWPNPDVVDVHVLFPDPGADPQRPESYDFAETDEYVKSVLATGARIVFRLGESIEHAPRKRHVNPPADARRWAEVCVNVVRHYNEGWADGFRHDIQYWEIWNEPDNRPNMWTGSDGQYFELYATTAGALKQRFPRVRVGGPAVGNTGELEGGALRPSPFVTKFLDFCRRENVPLDFFSWHVYAGDPRRVAARARAVRALLDGRGFRQTESHLDEWNYLPDDDWTAMLRGGQGLPRQRFFERVGGAEGAAFTAATLLLLQDAPVDVANYYSADTKPFGLFTEHGVPRKTFHAFRAFKMLLDTPRRLTVPGGADDPTVVSCAGTDGGGKTVALMAANFGDRAERLQLRFVGLPGGRWEYEVLLLDSRHDLEAVDSGTVAGELAVEAPGRSVCVVRLRR